MALEGRIPVLAIGSNAAPSQLERKFGRAFGVIPVVRAILHHHAVVYSAHFSRYGSLPATLHPHSGAMAYVFLVWLTPRQLERMHETEGIGDRYAYAEDKFEIESEGLPRGSRVGCYRSMAGPLRVRGTEVRLAEIPTTRCPLPALSHSAILRLVHRRLAPERPYRDFIDRIVREETCRRRMSRLLKRLDSL